MTFPHLHSVLTAASGTWREGQRLQTSSWLPRCKLSRLTLPPLERGKYAQITCAITTRYYAGKQVFELFVSSLYLKYFVLVNYCQSSSGNSQGETTY